MRSLRERVRFALAVAILTLGAALGAVAGENESRPFLWKATSEKNTVYLLGSIHLGKPSFYPLSEPVESAFKECPVLVVEADPNQMDLVETALLITEKGMYPQGKTVFDALNREERARLEKVAQEMDLPLGHAAQMRPWFLMQTLEVAKAQQLGYSAMFGVDLHFVKQASNQGKVVKELESMREQIEMLSSFSPELERSFLLQALDEMQNFEAHLNELLAAWRAGDAEKMAEVGGLGGEAEEEYPELFEKLVYERNDRMTDKIVGYLDLDTPHFVVVGSLHLVGDKGIVAQLRDRGFKVKQE